MNLASLFDATTGEQRLKSHRIPTGDSNAGPLFVSALFLTQPSANRSDARHAGQAGYKEVEGFGGVYGEPAALRKLLDAQRPLHANRRISPSTCWRSKKRMCSTIARTLGINKLVMPYLVPDAAAEVAPRAGRISASA